MTPYETEVLAILRSIDARLASMAPASAGVVGTAPIAPDSDLDSQWGNEEVRVNPRDWTGPSMKGQRMSECPPEFLDKLASTLDFFAHKNAASGAMTTGGKPKAEYDRRAAALARGWAKRLRSGWTPVMADDGPPLSAYMPVPADDDLPF